MEHVKTWLSGVHDVHEDRCNILKTTFLNLPVFKWPFEPFIATCVSTSCAVCSRFNITVCKTSFSEFENIDLRMPTYENGKKEKQFANSSVGT